MTTVGDKIGRYRLEAELGAGAMGRVYRAFDEQLRRTVALKVVLDDTGTGLSDKQMARTLREARAAAALNHPHIVAIHDVGEIEGKPYLVMEYVAGQSLRGYVGDDRVPWPRRVRWLVEIAEALDVAHAASLVHRDIKPENVLIREDGVAKVADFGIARRHQVVVDADDATATSAETLATLTEDGAVVGTPLYMSPEQLSAENVDGRTDQFGWGVMAFELLTGSLPWPATNLLKLVAAIMSQTPPPLYDRNPDVPKAVSDVVMKALARDPAERHRSMAEVAEALREHAELRTGSSGRSLALAATARAAADDEAVDAAPSEASGEPAGGASTTGAAVRTISAPPEPPPADQPARRARLGGLPLTMTVLALVGLISWLVPHCGKLGVGSESPGASGTALQPPADAGAVSTAEPSASTVPLYPCADQDAGAQPTCRDGAKAWCDQDQRRVACCADGLVALDASGLCGCPPGGLAQDSDAGAPCPRSELDSKQHARQIQQVVRGRFAAIRACFNEALKDGGAGGKIVFDFQIAPDGSLFHVHTSYVSIPDPAVQACALREFRALEFPPPPGGSTGVTYPINFSLDEDEAD